MRKRRFFLILALLIALGLTTQVFAAKESNEKEDLLWQEGTFRDGVYEGYYAQLDEFQKMLYDKLKEAFAEPVKEVTLQFDKPVLLKAKNGSNFTKKDLSQWIDDHIANDRGGRYAVFRDHPELPWSLAVGYDVEALGEYLYNKQGACIGFRMTGIFYENTYPWVAPEAYTNPEALKESVETAVTAIGEARPNRAATVRAIYDYLCELITYQNREETLPDKKGGNPHVVYYDQTSYNALVSPNFSICNGYSAAFKLLCDQYGIPCVHLSGKSFVDGQEANHAWNYVQLEDGVWYAVDPTWGDTQPTSYEHFLVGKNTINSAGVTFGDMHETPPYNNYLPACPTLSETAYPYLEARLDTVSGNVEGGGIVQIELSQVKSLNGAILADGKVGLFEESSKKPIATGSIQNGSVSLNYDTTKSGLATGRHCFSVKCMEGKQKGTILATMELTILPRSLPKLKLCGSGT